MKKRHQIGNQLWMTIGDTLITQYNHDVDIGRPKIDLELMRSLWNPLMDQVHSAIRGPIYEYIEREL